LGSLEKLMGGEAVDRDHTVLGDAALDLEKGAEGDGWQGFEARLLLGESFGDHAPGGAVAARIGDVLQPALELAVEVPVQRQLRYPVGVDWDGLLMWRFFRLRFVVGSSPC
jgi:hypothetical protein